MLGNLPLNLLIHSAQNCRYCLFVYMRVDELLGEFLSKLLANWQCPEMRTNQANYLSLLFPAHQAVSDSVPLCAQRPYQRNEHPGIQLLTDAFC